MALFNKNKTASPEECVGSILNAQDSAIVVVRGKACEVLTMNRAARRLLKSKADAHGNVPETLGELIPQLCDACPAGSSEPFTKPITCQIKGVDNAMYAVTYSPLQWLDGKPAVGIYARDVTEEHNFQQKLYNLAYIDQLTGVANRQKFKEDFEAAAPDIEKGNTAGVVCIFDLDNFKAVNDTYGHNTGDVMLRRITEHLNNQKAFKNHLYRLGGDEFVLFYTQTPDEFGDEEATGKYYASLLERALLSYTMPNIEVACTLSMGVAFFPQHGDNSSELLRKADIALYKAKAGGRNQFIFFEDQYDTAKKFKDMYINIQPILTKHGTTFGYELVDRGNDGAEEEDGLNLHEFDRTMDALGLSDMDSDARYFIAFSNQLLSKSVLNNLPREKFVVQVLLDEGRPDSGQMQRWQELKNNGYRLAFANLSQQNTSPALLALADYIKFAAEASVPFQKKLIAENRAKRFIATGIDTSAQFETAKQMGYLLFEGYFFNEQTVVKKTKDIDPLKVNYFRLLKLTSTDGYVDFQEISNVISSDVALSYKLLRLLNSAAVGLRNPVSSIDMAVAYLGEESLKQWVAMLALRGVASDKPLELVRMSLVRAHFGEMLAPHFHPPRNEKHVFLTGLLSLLHIALEKTQEELFEEIPVADAIRSSILTKEGPYSDLLAFYSNYEYANWDEVTRFAQENGLSDKLINDTYLASVRWYNSLAETDEKKPG